MPRLPTLLLRECNEIESRLLKRKIPSEFELKTI